MTTLIIDDEKQSHQVLLSLLKENHPNIHVKDHAYSVQDGIKKIKLHEPHLIFLDIEMPDGTGFDLLNNFQNANQLKFQVIFITAYNRYAQTAIRFGALDYILKPVSLTELSDAILRAKVKKLEYIQLAQMQIMQETLIKLNKKELPLRMSISTLKGVLYFPTEKIIRLEAMQNFTEFKVEEEERRLIASFNLKKFEDDLKPYDQFLRIHRSHIVNLKKVVRLKKGDKYYLEMSDGSILPVSKTQVKTLIHRLSTFTI